VRQEECLDVVKALGNGFPGKGMGLAQIDEPLADR
jgi:hypothetical protein